MNFSTVKQGSKFLSPKVFSNKFSEVYIVSATRSPIGSFNGDLASLSATDLGSRIVKSAVDKAGLQPDQVQEAFLGNVLSANLGQAPTKQAVLGAGLPNTIPCTTINKVCASGLKSTMLGASQIMLGAQDIVLTGGFESMSNAPYYLPQGRNGMRLGHSEVVDGIVKDGLWDVYNDFHMGLCAEDCAKKYSISREEQDNFTIEQYERVAASLKAGKFKDEITEILIKGKKGDTVVSEDQEFSKADPTKMTKLRSVFQKDGTVTAANASSINDGAAALILASKSKVDELGLKPLAKIIGFADAAQAPIEFTTAPSKSIPLALKKAGISQNEVDFWEINQAFAVVSLANLKLLNLDPKKVDVNGGSVVLGHPIGASGARILVTLLHVLKQNNGKFGVASICNGGGGASALVVQNL